MNIKYVEGDSIKCKSKLSLFITTNYNKSFIGNIKNIFNDYHWLQDKKCWEIPSNEDNKNLLTQLINNFKEYDKNFNKVLLKGSEGSKELDALVLPQINSKIKLFDHQIRAIRFGLIKNSFLIGDEMGLGKTATIIHYAILKKVKYFYKKCLVIVGVNGLKFNWVNEIEKISYESGRILGSRKYKQKNKKGLRYGGSKEILEDLNQIENFEEYFLITNIESLRNSSITNKLKELIAYNKIDMVVLDEAHVVKDPTSIQGKSFLKLRPKTRVAMTGTPIMNKPIELYTIFNWLDIDHHSFYQFKNHYCNFGGYNNKEIISYKNLGEIQDYLRIYMIRRLKDDILDLPDKIFTTEYLEMSKKQESIYNEVREGILKDVDKIIGIPNPLSAMTRLRQATADTSILSETVHESIKFDRLFQICTELKESGKKWVIFTNWSDVAFKAYFKLKDYFDVDIITGKTSKELRFKNILSFQNEGDCIIGTIGALGTGFNLDVASTVIFLDSPWNKALKDQAIDRLHRMTQKNNVNVITLVCKNTIDEKIEDLIYNKGKLSEALVDFTVNLNDSNKYQFVKYLLDIN